METPMKKLFLLLQVLLALAQLSEALKNLFV